MRFPFLNVALFVATIATTLMAGATQSPFGSGAQTLGGLIWAGAPFAASLVGILFCHEMGHYFAARAHRVESTLPFFIPVPFGIGTLGAVIRMRSAMPSRRAVIDIGAAGPMAGFVVAVPLLAWGLAHSEVKAVGEMTTGISSIGSPYAIGRGLRQLAHQYGSWGEALRHGSDLLGSGNFQFMGDSVTSWLVQQWVIGPLPEGHDVFLHPVAYAAWIGLLVTTLNLVPFGQLDGGHITYALLGRSGALFVSRRVSAGLLLAGLVFSWSWFVWWALTRFVVGPRHPPALSEEPLGPGRRALAFASLVLFAATFIPVPVSF